MDDKPKLLKRRCSKKKSVVVLKKRKVKRWECPPYHINNLTELLDFAWENRKNDNIARKLWKLIQPLSELEKMVGMHQLKEDIVYLVMYYVQGLHLEYDDKSHRHKVSESDMLHTVLYGSPGVGKTMVASILAKIYSRLGFLKTDRVIAVKRTDFIGKYVGHSEHKTKELLEKARGGVLLIDEAYSLGSGSRTDSFAKAAVDLLNQYLTEHKGDLVCIIAGYENELEESFFSINKGLKRRFPWKFTISNYTPKEMGEIMKSMVHRASWRISPDVDCEKFFADHKDKFPYFGGDIEVLFGKCKLAHTKRIFGLKGKEEKKLSQDDFDKGYNFYIKHKKQTDNDLNWEKHCSLYM